ncbi:MAG: hypothetical protein C0617_08150 [Desulfuromonas sp.]|uniref:hypothetical protein n=1 Tax=Desulfuromonas sp. TaxID=892 RepID=UPI000CC99B5C|nr:hypothetical protein [Desulfuromonas sp.]PLX84342.1 MAG: hypothetical protein C0617_08150 [Desulfuromonas sp.]
MASLEELLELSIRQYRALLDAGNKLTALVEQGRPGPIQDFCGELTGLQDEARRTDLELNALLRAAGKPVTTHSLFRERLELMRRVLAGTEDLGAKGRGMLSALNAERTSLTGGRTALSGYRVGPDRRGRIFNGPG